MTDETQTTPPAVTAQSVTDFETWLIAQPESVKTLYAAQVGNLKSALESERKAAKESEKAVKRLQEFEAAETKRKEEQMTREQLLEKQLGEMRQQVETTRAEAAAKLLKSAVLLKASEMGYEHPSDAYALAGLDPATEYTDAQIEAALKTLAGRLPVKAKGDGLGSPRLPNTPKPQNKQPVAQVRSPRY